MTEENIKKVTSDGNYLSSQNKIDLISTIIVVGFTLSVFHYYISVFYLGRGSTFLVPPDFKSNDFFTQVQAAKDLNPYYNSGGFASIYFPFSYIIFYIFSPLDRKLSFIIFSLIFIIYFAFYNYRNLNIGDNSNVNSNVNKFKNFFIFTFLTYPFLFEIDRGNLDSFLFISLSLFAYFYMKKDFSKSCLFLSFALAMKLFPGVFLVLFLKDKKYKEAVYTLLFAIGLTLGSLLLFKGGFTSNILGHLNNLKMDMNSVEYVGMAYGSSLWAVIHDGIIFISNRGFISLSIPELFVIYIVFAGILFILLSLYVIFIEKEFWKSYALLTFSILLLPFISFDYRLLLIFIPLYIFIKSSDRTFKNDLFYTITFALLLIPKNFFFILIVEHVSIGLLLNRLIMILMSAFIIWEGLKNRKSLTRQMP